MVGFGDNYEGTLIEGGQPMRVDNPTTLYNGETGIVEVRGGEYAACILLGSGQIKCLGNDYYSQLGRSTTSEYHNPLGLVEGIPITVAPTALPTLYPTVLPTALPTSLPTTLPTSLPTALPTFSPTNQPSLSPTSAPTKPTKKPTAEPTSKPTRLPTAVPTKKATREPTTKPTKQPTVAPTKKPTREPTAKPTKQPTGEPTLKPTKAPVAQNPGEYDMCKPNKATNKAACTRLIKTCNTGGIVMKWFGAGCTINGKKAQDGGCQCDGYCGFKCKSACNNSASKLCVWDTALKACKIKGTNEAYEAEGEQCTQLG